MNYTVKEFSKISGLSGSTVRRQIANKHLKAIIANEYGKISIIIVYDGNPLDFIPIYVKSERKYIVGYKKGLLTIVNRVSPRRLECICDCGNTVIKRVEYFSKSDSSKISCGCNRTNQSNNSKSSNDIIKEGIMVICKSRGVSALLNLDDPLRMTFDNMKIEIDKDRFIFSHNKVKLTPYIYKKYGYKYLSFAEELHNRRT